MEGGVDPLKSCCMKTMKLKRPETLCGFLSIFFFNESGYKTSKANYRYLGKVSYR
jgi:hypothetical protein